eukprot:jgi/Tetstr1/447367/TSEL_034804.t1
MPSALDRSREALMQSKHRFFETRKHNNRDDSAFDVNDYRGEFDAIASNFEKAVFRFEDQDPIQTMEKMVAVSADIRRMQETMASHGITAPGPPCPLEIEVPGIGESDFFRAYTCKKSVLESYSKEWVMTRLVDGFEYMQEYLEEFEKTVFGEDV